MGLFEVITSPQKTPQSSTVQVTETITLTPAKKNLDFSKLNDEQDSPPEFKTPQKPVVVQQQTPLYLKPGGFKEITASPSPLLTQRIKKGLSTIISEFEDIQAELKYGDFEDEDIVPLEDIDEEDEEELDDDNEADVPRQKKKTQKRTTRRYVIKARPSAETSTMEGKDIKKELKKLEKEQKDQADVVSDESEEWSDGPDEFVPRPRQEPSSSSSRGKKKGGESQNFKRLKLRDGRSKRNFGKRSRGW